MSCVKWCEVNRFSPWLHHSELQSQGNSTNPGFCICWIELEIDKDNINLELSFSDIKYAVILDASKATLKLENFLKV